MRTTSRARPLPADERRASIVTAALPLVREHGRAVTTRQIATAAGVAEGTVFHVFADKDALIAAVVNSVLQPGQLVAELAEIDCELPLRDRVVRIVELLRRRMTSVFELMTALGIHGPPVPTGHGGPDGSGGRSALRDKSMRQVTDCIAELLRPDADQLRYPPAETTRLIRLFTFAACHPALTDLRPLPAAQIADVLLSGITTHPSSRTGDHAGRVDISPHTRG